MNASLQPLSGEKWITCDLLFLVVYIFQISDKFFFFVDSALRASFHMEHLRLNQWVCFLFLFAFQGHSHMRDSCHHEHAGHSHSHGPRAAAFSGATNLFTPAYGQLGKLIDPTMDICQQPKKRSHMDDSSSWDIVKATQWVIGLLKDIKLKLN